MKLQDFWELESKMHCTSFFPGYYYARDLIPGATSIPWPQLNKDITRRNGTGDNVPLQQCTVDHYMGYAKKVMRQAVLEHEAIFRNQVHELHRLYRRQKELMDEFQRRYIQLQMSQMNPAMYNMQSHISQKPLNFPGWPFVNGRGCDPSILSAEKFCEPFVALHSEQGDSKPPSKIENGKNEPNVLPSITNKFGKRMLDLELPADLYVDGDEEENNVEENVEVPQRQWYPPKKTSLLECDLKQSSSRSIGSPVLNLSCRRPTCLIDLNEPFQLDESDTPNSPSHIESAMCCMEISSMDQDLSQKLKKELEVLDSGRDCTVNVGKDIDACSNVVHLEETQVEALPHNSEAGLGGAPYNLKLVSSSERTIMDSKFSEDGHDLHSEVHPKALNTSISSSRQLFPQSAEPKTKSLSSISSGRKSIQDLRKIPEIVQALPCFNTPGPLDKSSKSDSESSRNNREMLCTKDNSASNPSFRNIISSPTASSNNDLSSEVGSPSKRFKNSDNTKSSVHMDFNHMPPRWSSGMVAPQENEIDRDDANDSVDSVKAPGLQRKSCSDGHTFGFSDLTKTNNFDNQFTALDPASCTFNGYEVKDIDNNEKMGKTDTTTAHDAILMSAECIKGDLDVGTGMGNDLSRFKALIDLNSSRNEAESSAAAREEDLEAPVSPENKECSPPRGESENLQLEINVRLSKEDHQGIRELDKIAAEAIISMSSGVQLCLEAVTNKSSKVCGDCLQWFAGIVSFVAEENDVEELLNCAPVGNHIELKSVGNDYFVATKSRLKEIKAEPVHYRRNEQNDEETADGFVPTLQSRGRRARKSRVFKKKALNSLGVLKGAANGAALDNFTRRKRNMGGNGFTKRRPYLNIDHCNGLEQFMFSHSTRAKNNDRGRILRGWGLTKGRRKARSGRSGCHGFPLLPDFHRLSS